MEGGGNRGFGGGMEILDHALLQHDNRDLPTLVLRAQRPGSSGLGEAVYAERHAL